MRFETVKLGEICRIEKGAIGIQKAIPGEFPMVVTGEERKSHNEFQFDDEAVIIPLVSGTGHGHASIKRIHFQKGKFALGSILCAVIPKDKTRLNAEYLFRFLDLNKENELVARMKGMANVTLPLKEIAQIELPLPSLKEQIEFVEMYNQLESRIELLATELTHQRSLVKKLRQQILQDAVQGKLVPQDPNDEPAGDLLRKIKAEKAKLVTDKKLKKEKELPAIKPEELPFEIPEGWVWCRLGEICTKVTDGFHNTPKKLKEGKKYISATHIREDGIKWKDCLYVSEKDHMELFNKAYPQIGEILITNRGAGCSTPVIIDIEEEFSFQNAALIGFNQNLVSNWYLFYFILKSRDEIMKIFVNGGLQPMLSNVVLSTIPIPFPPLAEQHRIVQKLNELMQTCDALEASIQQSVSLNEKLLQMVLREALKGGD